MELKYKFSYGNFINFILSQVIIISYHFFTVLCLLFFVFIVIGDLENSFKEQNLVTTILRILSVLLIVLWLAYLTIILFIPKKVILNFAFIKIRRYFLNISYLIRGFNDEIYLNDVIECKKYDGKRERFNRTGPYSVFYFDWNDLVEIKTENKTYLVPIKNSDNFIAEVNKRLGAEGDVPIV